jgi:hypothetical protein
MTNIFQTSEKVTLRDALRNAGEQALIDKGWTLERVAGTGKSSVRLARKGDKKLLISLKTTQDTWLAFSRTQDDKAWSTLADVDAVVVASVYPPESPDRIKVHMFDAALLRERFDRAYAARKAAGHVIPVGRGVWIALYQKESRDPVSLVGAGAGLEGDDPILEILIPQNVATAASNEPVDERLTIPEAKRRLALTFGVDPSSIKISVEG